MEQEYEEDQPRSIGDYIAIAKRRRKPIVIVACLVLSVAVLAAFLWPPTYRSTAVILIEEQDVPQDLVRSTITSYAVQRIEEIRQRIMTIGNIMSIVERFKLYTEDELRRLTRTEISQDFRSAVMIQPINAEVIDPRSGRPTEAVIAFSLSFEGRKIDTVHKVANELVTLYLNENLRERTEQSTSTSEFLSAEAGALDGLLKDLEQQISVFKEEHQGSLPELNQFNLSIVDRSQRELLDITTRRQELERRKIELAADLAQLNPTSPQILPSGQAVLSDSDRLKALRSEYRQKTAIYRQSHPDLQRLQREIGLLEDTLGEGEADSDIAGELRTAREQLLQYRDRYTDNHPQVTRVKNMISQLEDRLLIERRAASEVIPDNPAYVLLSTQLQTIDSEIEALLQKQQSLRGKIEQHDNLLSRTPAVEKEYQALLRDYENARMKYREIKAKQMEAELARSLEQERKGERFTLIQPPEIPEDPVSPNRTLLLALGLALALALGAGSGVLLEMLDPRVYGEKNIVAATGVASMVLIPYMEDEKDSGAMRRRYLSYAGGATASALVAVTVFHNFVKPLDVAWFILLRKLGLH